MTDTAKHASPAVAQRLVETLKECSPEHPASLEKLLRSIGMKDNRSTERILRYLMSDLVVRYGVPVIAHRHKGGYYIATSRDVLMNEVKALRHQASEITLRANNLVGTSTDNWEPFYNDALVTL